MKKGMEMQMQPTEWGADRKPYHMGQQSQMSGTSKTTSNKEEKQPAKAAQTPHLVR